MRCEDGLADVSLGTDATDGRRAPLFDRSQAGAVESLHRLFVDQDQGSIDGWRVRVLLQGLCLGRSMACGPPSFVVHRMFAMPRSLLRC